MNPEDKIRKLLDLASSSNEHEAKLALDRARELMAKYCITLGESEATKPTVISKDYIPPIRLSAANFKYSTMIVGTLSKHFGVMPLIYRGNTIRIYGFESNLKLAFYTFDSIFNQLQAAFKIGYSKERSITFTEAFWYGAAQGISRKFALDEKIEKGLIVYDPVRAEIERLKTGIFETQLNPTSIAGQIQGQRAGNEASIYKGVQNSQERGNLLV